MSTDTTQQDLMHTTACLTPARYMMRNDSLIYKVTLIFYMKEDHGKRKNTHAPCEQLRPLSESSARSTSLKTLIL